MNYSIKNKFALDIDSGADFIICELERNGFEGYIVGGCVRDCIMGRIPNDWDITTNALPNNIIDIFDHTVPTGLEHGTVTIIMGNVGYEATTYRIDGEYSDLRRPKNVEFSKNLEDDLSRRDFTINAIAYNKKIGIIDAFGGIEDIEKKIIKCVGDPDKRFNEDALRIIRAVRFSAKLGFNIDSYTYKSMVRNIDNLKSVSMERINKELEEIIEYDATKLSIFNDTGISDWLFGSSLFKENLYFSAKLKENEIYFEDFDTSIQICKRALAFKNLSNEELKKVMRNLRYSKKDIELTYKVHKIINNNKYYVLIDEEITENEKKILIKYILRELGHINLAKYTIYTMFIEKNTNPTICFKLFNDIIDSEECFSFSNLGLNGKDIIENHIGKGASVGKILEALLEHVIVNPLDNEKDVLLALAKNYKIM